MTLPFHHARWPAILVICLALGGCATLQEWFGIEPTASRAGPDGEDGTEPANGTPANAAGQPQPQAEVSGAGPVTQTSPDTASPSGGSSGTGPSSGPSGPSGPTDDPGPAPGGGGIDLAGGSVKDGGAGGPQSKPGDDKEPADADLTSSQDRSTPSGPSSDPADRSTPSREDRVIDTRDRRSPDGRRVYDFR